MPKNKEKRVKKQLSKIVWIFCEGETERYYLEHFKEDMKFSYKIEIDQDRSTAAKKIYEKAHKKLKDYESEISDSFKVWLVFDKDYNSDKELENIFKSSDKEGIEIAFSNICFEVWALLHFGNAKRYTKPDDAEEALKKFYPGCQKPYKDLFHKIKKDIENAIKRAEGLDKKEEPKYTINPYTNIYKLLQGLIDFDGIEFSLKEVMEIKNSLKTNIPKKFKNSKCEFNMDGQSSFVEKKDNKFSFFKANKKVYDNEDDLTDLIKKINSL